MYTNAQDGIDKAAYSLMWGAAKEAKDLFSKTLGNKEFYYSPIETGKKAILDSIKDTKNNLEGIRFGLQNPNLDGGTWLNDLDYKTNTWKK